MRFNRDFRREADQQSATGEATRQWSDGDWAWVFARENEDLKRDFRESRAGRLRIHQHSCGMSFVRLRRQCPSAERHGLAFLPDPATMSATFPIPWLPAINPRSAVLQPMRPGADNSNSAYLDFTAIGAVSSLLVLGPAGAMLFLRVGSSALVVRLSGRSPLFGPVAVKVIIDGLGRFASAAKAIRHLQHALQGEVVRDDVLPATSAQRRLRTLKTLYAKRSKSSLRQIAIALHGAERIKTAWADPASRALKDEARRARDKVRALIAGGYRDLFRP